VKTGTRNTRGKLFIYLWKRLLPVLGDVVDTLCGFKAYRAAAARYVVQDTIEKRFAFDIEQLVKLEHARNRSIAIVPIAWIDRQGAQRLDRQRGGVDDHPRMLPEYRPMWHYLGMTNSSTTSWWRPSGTASSVTTHGTEGRT
jgi:hypothetical protein